MGQMLDHVITNSHSINVVLSEEGGEQTGELTHRGAGINTWTAISSNDRIKEQTMFDLKSSSLIWEYWPTKKISVKPQPVTQTQP